MRFSKAVVKCRVPILILTLLLMIPAVLGMAGTRINYDMLDYLPEDMDTVAGQNELLEEFNKGAFSLLILEDLPEKEVAALKAKVERVDHVETVLWYDPDGPERAHGAPAGEAVPGVQHGERHDDGRILRHLHVLGPDHGRNP